MKRSFVVIATLVVGMTVLAQAKAHITDEEKALRKAKFYEVQMKKNGGILTKPGSQKGNFSIFYDSDYQTEVFENIAKKLSKEFKISVVNRKCESIRLDAVDEIIGKYDTNLSLFITIDDKSNTTLLIAPENKWGILNIKPLINGAAKDRVAIRIEKEILRAFAILSGSFSSQFPNTILSAVTKTSDLDSINSSKLPPDIKSRIIPYLSSFGITPYKQANYRKACEEGWAPAPTNEYQKAIWDKVHAMPTAPLKIKPETKKVVQ